MPAPSQPASSMDRLVARLASLPGLGKRSAERIAVHLLRGPEGDAVGLADAIRDFRRDLKVCHITGHVTESDPCYLVTDPSRDQSTILVVEQPADVVAIEQTGAYRGSYHVLLGRIAPLDAVGPGDLNADSLLARVRGRLGPPVEGGIREVILGLNPTLEGDGTALYLARELEPLGVRVTRLPRGLPINAPLANVSKAVLSDAVQGRQAVE